MVLLLYDESRGLEFGANKRPIALEMPDFIELDEIEPVCLTTFLSSCHRQRQSSWCRWMLNTAVSQQSKG